MERDEWIDEWNMQNISYWNTLRKDEIEIQIYNNVVDFLDINKHSWDDLVVCLEYPEN